MSETTIALIHVHRANLHDPLKQAKWYVHLPGMPGWGNDPREFKTIIINVPCYTREGGLPGYADNPSCGCANAWLECVVSIEDVSMSDDYLTLTIGIP